MDLILQYAPEKYRTLKSYVASILVSEGFPALGRYWEGLKMVELRESYVRDPETTHQHLACCLIHEAQHGRLRRLGIGYEEPIRVRVERICMTAERNFARKLPGCEALVESLQESIEFEWEPYLSNRGKQLSELEFVLRSLKENDQPRWMIRLAEWAIDRVSRS